MALPNSHLYSRRFPLLMHTPWVADGTLLPTFGGQVVMGKVEWWRIEGRGMYTDISV